MMEFLLNPWYLAGLTLFSLAGAVLLGWLSWQLCCSLDRGGSLGRWLSFWGRSGGGRLRSDFPPGGDSAAGAAAGGLGGGGEGELIRF